MTPYYSDDQTTLYHGDALSALTTLMDGSVDCIVTSPPYFGLRDYGVDGQIGAESSPAEFVAALVAVFREARRVLADDGTLWLNLGDSYSSKSKGSGGTGKSGLMKDGRNERQRIITADRSNAAAKGAIRRITPNAPDKNLLGIPWRVAFALQDDGWILRNDIIWAKPNAMPESVTDRLSTKHEHLFLFSKSRRYWFDLDPIREVVVTERHEALAWGRDEQGVPGQKPQHRPGRASGTNLQVTGRRHRAQDASGRNPGDVWIIPTQPFGEAHFAVFPLEIPRRAIAAGCKPAGVVLDPFSGSGTTGKAAAELGRRYVGIDLNRDYLDLSLRTRLVQPSLTSEAGVS